MATTPFTTLAGFTALPFPKCSGIVYVLCADRPDGLSLPFYVGQSSTRHLGRLGDYVSAKFSASTDFKVGEAVRWLRQQDIEVSFHFKETDQPRVDEKLHIDLLRRAGTRLLNDMPGYQYQSADEEIERRRIQAFMASVLEANPRIRMA